MNAQSTKTPVKVGDVVLILKRHGDRPTTDNVAKVTKGGWLELNATPGVKFKPSRFTTGRYEGGRDVAVFLYSDEKLAELSLEAEQVEAERAAKKAEQDRRTAERGARIAAELAEVKAACGGSLLNVTTHRQLLADGARLVLLTVPVKAEFVERKGPEEVVIVSLRDVEETDWDAALAATSPFDRPAKVKRVEAHPTCLNKSTSSFSSCSGDKFANDEDALWEAVRSCYHSW